MASRKRDGSKLDLIALHRLEFYKHKNNWKLSRVKEPKSDREPSTSGSNSKLNETYNIEPVPAVESDSEGTSLLNDAFMHEIPTDSTAPQLDVEPLQTSLQSEDQSDLSTSTQRVQDNGIRKSFPNTDACVSWPDSQPVDNLKWLLKAASLSWTQQPPENIQLNQTPCPGSVMDTPANPVKSTDSSERNHVWPCQLSGVVHSNEGLPATSCHNIENKSIYNQLNQYTPQDKCTKPMSGNILRNNPLDSGPIPQKEVNNWHNDIGPPKYPPDIWHKYLATGDTQVLNVPQMGPARSASGNMRQDMTDSCNGRFDGNSQKFSNIWSNQATLSETKDQNTWCYSAPPPSPDVLQQNRWTNQLWQEKQDLLQAAYKEWAMTSSADVLDAAHEQAGDTWYSTPLNKSDMCMSETQGVMEQPPQESCELQTTAEVRENTIHWLRRLTMAYMNNKEDDSDCEPLQDQCQHGCNSSTDFIREAHEGPHSSEKDPNESWEWSCDSVSAARLAAAPGGWLHRAALLALASSRRLLAEQALREQLRAQRCKNMDEHPTRDTNLFGDEYVLSGSHIPHSTAALHDTGPGRIIKINMGRPYRLNTNN